MKRLFCLLALFAGYAFCQYPTGGNCKLMDKEYYQICYSSQWKEPQWVAYQITKDQLEGPGDRRNSHFYPDPDLEPGERAELSDYLHSGYSRGHMAPAAAFKQSQAAMDATHSLANIVPQLQGHNAGLWANLEKKARVLALAFGVVKVLVGPHIGYRYDVIGQGVAVPDALWMVVQYGDQNTVAVLTPHVNRLPNKPDAYTIAIDDLEEELGLDFPFPEEIESVTGKFPE